jgi:hypothetical protein
LVYAGVALAQKPIDKPTDKKPDDKGDSKNDPQGTWKGADTLLTLKNGRLSWVYSAHAPAMTIRLEADYSTTKDSLLYAVITKISYGISVKGEAKAGEDDTFSFRFRVDENELRIRDIKGKGFEEMSKLFAGRYMKQP